MGIKITDKHDFNFVTFNDKKGGTYQMNKKNFNKWQADVLNLQYEKVDNKL